jgi:hypothetical protein
MPDTGRVRLHRIVGHSGIALQGEPALVAAVMGLGIGTMGVVVSIRAWYLLGVGWEGVCFGLALMSAGAYALVHAARARRARARQELLREANPLEPWMADHPWDRRGERRSPWTEATLGAVGLVVLALLITPFNVWAVRSHDGHAIAFSVLGDIAFLGLAGSWVYRRARAVKYGATWITFEEFPFFLGRRLRVRLGTSQPIGRFTRATAVLRFVREVYETGEKGHQRVVCYQEWADTQVLAPQYVSPSGEVPVAFELPDGKYETALASRPPQYWEIELTVETPGIDLRSRFLVPVYRAASEDTPRRP